MMQGASAEGWNWLSPSVSMDGNSAKKARLELPNGHVKQEFVVEQEAGAGAEGAVAAEYGSRVDVAVRIDRRPLCSRPYKPHVFKSKGGHFACAACVADLPGGQCEACGTGGGGFVPCPELDTVFSSTRIACPHAGCGRFVVYHEAEEHQKNACAHAPCHCTEPGCVDFAPGTAAALAGHLATVHSVPVHTIRYGKVSPLLQVPASVPRLLLVAEDDGRVFLLTVGALGAAAAVSVVCVRASAAPRPRFTCKMWVNQVPADGGRSDVVLVEMQMRSSTSPGAVVPADEPTFLAVPRMYMVPGPGVVPAMEVALRVRIDKQQVSPRRAGLVRADDPAVLDIYLKLSSRTPKVLLLDMGNDAWLVELALPTQTWSRRAQSGLGRAA